MEGVGTRRNLQKDQLVGDQELHPLTKRREEIGMRKNLEVGLETDHRDGLLIVHPVTEPTEEMRMMQKAVRYRQDGLHKVLFTLKRTEKMMMTTNDDNGDEWCH